MSVIFLQILVCNFNFFLSFRLSLSLSVSRSPIFSFFVTSTAVPASPRVTSHHCSSPNLLLTSAGVVAAQYSSSSSRPASKLSSDWYRFWTPSL